MEVRRLGAVAVLALLLAACDYGTTAPPTHVADTSAVLEGTLHTDDAGSTVTWWFEYGPTTALGTTTPERSGTFYPGGTNLPVQATVTGLDEGTTLHYRSCVRNAAGGGICGAIQSFTTTTGRDSVQGLGITEQIPMLGYALGAYADASAEADGSSPEGIASRSPGTYYFRIADEGPVVCLRVEGNRAAVGYLADWTIIDPTLPLVPIVLHIEDNGPTGDRYAVDVVDESPTTCPDPDDLLDAVAGNPVLIGDGFVVHDHP
jgi:hypothetical protein